MHATCRDNSRDDVLDIIGCKSRTREASRAQVNVWRCWAPWKNRASSGTLGTAMQLASPARVSWLGVYLEARARQAIARPLDNPTRLLAGWVGSWWRLHGACPRPHARQISRLAQLGSSNRPATPNLPHIPVPLATPATIQQSSRMSLSRLSGSLAGQSLAVPSHRTFQLSSSHSPEQ